MVKNESLTRHPQTPPKYEQKIIMVLPVLVPVLYSSLISSLLLTIGTIITGLDTFHITYVYNTYNIIDIPCLPLGNILPIESPRASYSIPNSIYIHIHIHIHSDCTIACGQALERGKRSFLASLSETQLLPASPYFILNTHEPIINHRPDDE